MINQIKGLEDYVKLPEYRTPLGLSLEKTETYELLAQGEYNINYVFTHPVKGHPLFGKKLLLRVNCGSQMHLENQIQYEYDALKVLEHSGRTPKVYYVDGSLSKLSHGVLVMEYLPGVHLDYKKDLLTAAECLADVHSVTFSNAGTLLEPSNPLRAILEECEEMVKVYVHSPLAKEPVKAQIRKMLDKAWKIARSNSFSSAYKCCINTELNSTNFLVDSNAKKAYLIDWEKPLYGDPAQDLGHFLAPTTTFWKTDVLLTKEQTAAFLKHYIQSAAGRFPVEGLTQRVNIYTSITCLRGITWCAMAWVEYQSKDRLIWNASTFRKLEQYLDMQFLCMIDKQYLV